MHAATRILNLAVIAIASAGASAPLFAQAPAVTPLAAVATLPAASAASAPGNAPAIASGATTAPAPAVPPPAVPAPPAPVAHTPAPPAMMQPPGMPHVVPNFTGTGAPGVASRGPAPAAPPMPAATGLPPDAPKLVLNGGMYSPSPQLRMAIVNGSVVREGADLGAGVVLEQIKPQGVVVAFRGNHYTIIY